MNEEEILMNIIYDMIYTDDFVKLNVQDRKTYVDTMYDRYKDQKKKVTNLDKLISDKKALAEKTTSSIVMAWHNSLSDRMYEDRDVAIYETIRWLDEEV